MELFTKKYLQSESSERSFERGKELYICGDVTSVKFSENTIYGRVQGSHLYKTEIIFARKGEYYFYCSCPYSYGGLCKHEIALGLYVLEHPEVFKTDAKDEIRTLIENSDPKVLTDFIVDSLFHNSRLLKEYKSILKKIQEDKIRAEKEKIQEQIQKEKEAKKQESAKAKTKKLDFDKISDKVKTKIELLDFNNYSELMKKHFQENKGYDDFEILSMSADIEIKDELKKFLIPVKALIVLKDYLNAFKYLTEIIFGLITADTTNIDKTNTIYTKNDIKYHILHYFREFVNNYDIYYNLNCNLNSENSQNFIDILFNKLENLENYIKTTEMKLKKNYFELINDFLLMFIKSDEKSNLYLKEKLNNSEIKEIKQDFIYKRLYGNLNDVENWLSYLKPEEYQKKKDNMMKILKFYENNKEKFIYFAKTATFWYDSGYLTYLSNHLTKEDDTDFLKKILFELCLNDKTIESFKKIKNNYDKNVLIEFADMVYEKFFNNNDYYYYYHYGENVLFYLDILKEGELYDMIFNFMKKNPNHKYYNEAVNIVLNLYPERCFAVVTETCKNNLIKHVSSNVYKFEAERLKNLLNVNDDNIKERVTDLAEEICRLYPTRKVLQEEFSRIY